MFFISDNGKSQTAKFCGQVIKSLWGMPWRLEAMKDVVACDKLRLGGKHPIDPQISEWGNPAGVMSSHLYMNK